MVSSSAMQLPSAAHPPHTLSSAALASASLGLLLREDPLLVQHELHVSGKTEEVSFAYAASLLESEDADEAGGNSSSQHPHDVTQRAMDALSEVNRKLALVESLAERVSRTSPEAVAGTLLTLHGYTVEQQQEAATAAAATTTSTTTTTTTNAVTTTTLPNIRERCDRLERQGELLEGVVRRVETSLGRGLKRMNTSTTRLSRVLQLSTTLKMILRFHFESSKLTGYDLEDLRDLSRAAASVAIIEDLLRQPELNDASTSIQVVQHLRPAAEKTAAAVRRSAAALLEQHHNKLSSSSSAVVQLGATLQVYYHLGELPQAAWKAVDRALIRADETCTAFWSPQTLSRIMEQAVAEAKQSISSAGGKKSSDASAHMQRELKKKLREVRGEAAAKWASGITDAALDVWNLHRVLCRKSDPVTRQVYVDVVSTSAIPEKFAKNGPHRASDFSIFSIFWNSLCQDKIAVRLRDVLEFDNGRFTDDMAALYPAVRSAALNMMGYLQDTMQAGVGNLNVGEDTSAAASSGGILGGSAALDDAFLGWSGKNPQDSANLEGSLGVISADTWTRSNKIAAGDSVPGQLLSSSASSTNKSVYAIFNSSEWKALEGFTTEKGGLFPLQEIFVEESSNRLTAPLQYMFPDNNANSIDEDGAATSALPLLPSRYDVQKFDENIRQELSLADPRQGGGEFTAVTMISANVVNMVVQFCEDASNALCNPDEDVCLQANGMATDALSHDIKVTKILHALTSYVKNAPEKTFLEPYRPTILPQHEEAGRQCAAALSPAVREIEKMVNTILSPLSRALNRRIASTIARVHLRIHKNDTENVSAPVESFVQKYLSLLFEEITTNHLSKLSNEYAGMIASSLVSFSIYTFISNISLVRPICESARLHITQDITDLEMVLDQFLSKSGSSLSLSQIENGKPYAELRAVRSMLFWSGFDDTTKDAAAIAKSVLREAWVKDVRPSTLSHYLFSFAPSLLSSPHHSKRMKAEEYVATLVLYDGTFEDGEASAWMTTIACCDLYQQRESVERNAVAANGDARVAGVLMMLGPELLRRRRQ